MIERVLFECEDCDIHEWREFKNLTLRLLAEKVFGVKHIDHDFKIEADYVIEARHGR